MDVVVESHHGGLDPSGCALRGFDHGDDGHLEGPWTGGVVASGSRDFLVTVRTGS